MGFAFAMPSILLSAHRPLANARAIEICLLLAAVSLLALLGLRARVVSESGAVAGLLCTMLSALALGWRGLLLIMLLAALAAAVTRFHDRRRADRALAHKTRAAGEILANLAPATLCVAPSLFTQNARSAIAAAFLAALAESAADTTASELGEELGGEPVLITTLRPAPIGCDGAVSALGTLFGAAAAALLVTVALWLGVVGPLGASLAFLAACAGLFVDSLLGAVYERAGSIGNNTVNFVSSSFAAALALGLWSLLALGQRFLRAAL